MHCVGPRFPKHYLEAIKGGGDAIKFLCCLRTTQIDVAHSHHLHELGERAKSRGMTFNNVSGAQERDAEPLISRSLA